jgi:predicted metal-dependent HD superfamily phosphohydrolase
MDDDLRRRWEGTTGVLLVDPAASTRALRDLWRRYDEPHRAYHRLAHIRHVLEVVDVLRAAEGLDDPIAVQVAAWYHDAVLEPGAPGNEARSADLAAAVLEGWGIDPDRIAHIRGLILTTAAHEPGDDPDAAVLVDADLAILAADPDTYEVHRRAVRVEHPDLDEPAWRAGRAASLERLLARPRIYTTATMRARGEAAARRNLTAELAALR